MLNPDGIITATTVVLRAAFITNRHAHLGIVHSKVPGMSHQINSARHAGRDRVRFRVRVRARVRVRVRVWLRGRIRISSIIASLPIAPRYNERSMREEPKLLAPVLVPYFGMS